MFLSTCFLLFLPVSGVETSLSPLDLLTVSNKQANSIIGSDWPHSSLVLAPVLTRLSAYVWRRSEKKPLCAFPCRSAVLLFCYSVPFGCSAVLPFCRSAVPLFSVVANAAPSKTSAPADCLLPSTSRFFLRSILIIQPKVGGQYRFIYPVTSCPVSVFSNHCLTLLS